MHGVIFLELNRFAVSRLGSAAWADVVQSAGLTQSVYLPTQLYPDADLLGIVSALSRRMNLEPSQILEEFGVYIVPSLATLYAALIDADWTLLDLLEHTETTIHRVVRIRAPGAAPPQIKCSRLGPTEAEILYTSERKLCAFARGIIRGLARLYEESATITEPDCMRRGQPFCRLLVKTGVPKPRRPRGNP
jgi:predicted hydrocarbon binding protein